MFALNFDTLNGIEKIKSRFNNNNVAEEFPKVQ
jgi:hypothetical protein